MTALNEMTNEQLAALIRDAGAILASRLATGQAATVPPPALSPVTLPTDEERDFALGVARFLESGGNVLAADRDRIADIATRHPGWVKRQGLPTERGKWAWRKIAERNRTGKTKER